VGEDMKNESVEELKELSDFYDKDHKYKHNKEKKVFRIACDWSVYGTMEIEAGSLMEAIEIADNDCALPTDTEYMVGSFQINEDITGTFYDQDHNGG
jgi:hypothetical protein